MSTNVQTNGGIGFVGLLQILFIGLKLANVIQWKWLWVLAPTWIGFAIIIVALLIVAGIFLCTGRYN